MQARHVVLFLVFFGSAPIAVDARPLAAKNGLVVSAHRLASEAGVAMLKRGGNAVDAAVATAFSLAVVEPYSSGIGGGGFMMVYLAKQRKVLSIDFRDRAPGKATELMFKTLIAAGKSPSLYGGLAIAVPGLVAGLFKIHRKYGKLPWRVVVGPAIRQARRGFKVTSRLIEAIKVATPHFNAAGKTIFLPKGKPPLLGSMLRQTALARTLSAIARRGPSAFYRGRLARQMVATIKQHSGIVSEKDFENYKAVYRQPISGTYRGLQIYTMPPPSSGGVHLVQMLNVLENFDLKKLGFRSSASLHLLAEVMRYAYRDRARFLGDPDFVKVPIAGLISKPYAKKIARWFDPSKSKPLKETPKRKGPLQFKRGSTSHYSIVDRFGNAVSSTQTINLWFGSGVVCEKTGVVFNDQMDDFSVLPGVPNVFGVIGGKANAIAPGKRPLSSMTPTLVLKDGRIHIVAGSPGGSRIITTVLQVLINLIDYKTPLAHATLRPRIHHQWVPELLYFEQFGLTRDVRSNLERLGHKLSRVTHLGNAQTIIYDAENKWYLGQSDPRGEGVATGY